MDFSLLSLYVPLVIHVLTISSGYMLDVHTHFISDNSTFHFAQENTSRIQYSDEFWSEMIRLKTEREKRLQLNESVSSAIPKTFLLLRMVVVCRVIKHLS